MNSIYRVYVDVNISIPTDILVDAPSPAAAIAKINNGGYTALDLRTLREALADVSIDDLDPDLAAWKADPLPFQNHAICGDFMPQTA